MRVELSKSLARALTAVEEGVAQQLKLEVFHTIQRNGVDSLQVQNLPPRIRYVVQAKLPWQRQS